VVEARDDFAGNVERGNALRDARELAKIGKPLTAANGA
jgi:predicted metalloendopeptidase